MKFLVLVAIFVAVSCAKLKPQKAEEKQYEDSNTLQSFWQPGKVYSYNVETFNLASLEEGTSSGSNTKATLYVRVKSPHQLQAKLEHVQHAEIHHDLAGKRRPPRSLEYQPKDTLEQAFEVNVDAGRVLSLNLPASINLEDENFLKGVLSTLQVDLTPNRKPAESHDFYDKERGQGHFRKMETDVTGDCETLYSVAPLPVQNQDQYYDEQPIEITKMKDYGKCNHRVAYHFGVPVGAEWTGTAHSNKENQFMERATKSRVVAGKAGPIYKAETTSTVYVSPLMYGKQKAEIYSRVSMELISVEEDSQPQWEVSANMRPVQNLLYSLRSKSATIDYSSTSSSSESDERRDNLSNEENNLSSDEQNAGNNRVRRSSKDKFRAVSINKMVIEKNLRPFKGESESDSSSDSSSAYENDELPKANEPAYASLYLSPQSRVPNKRSPLIVQKLVQEFAQQIQNANNMPKADVLSKFNIIVRVIAMMSTEELAQTSRNIETAKSANNVIKTDMWMVLRDAVAQAGTMPAFQQIKTWISTKKLQGEEAAQVVGSLAYSLRYPTRELMTQFFNLAISEEIKEQRYLNTTALIAAARFINLGYVNKKESHSRYPTQMYGRLSGKNEKFVEEQILPKLQEEMDNAIARDDNYKAQVMIKAMGTLGHNAIIRVFAPYLEGKIPTSTYLRRYMVENLDVLSRQKDEFARSVLYSVIKNTGEEDEVRVAAIFNIFAGRPTSSMMNSMAYMTQEDPSYQVRSALKSAIETAADLKNPRYNYLSRTAQEAKHLLTKKELSPLFSKRHYLDYFDAEEEMGVFGALSYMGSENSNLPKYLQYVWTNQAQGYERKNTLTASLSNDRSFLDSLWNPLYRNDEQKQSTETNHKYPAEYVAKMLNIKRDMSKSQEASFHLHLMNQERYFAFGDEEIQMLNNEMITILEKLAKGVDYHYSKTFNAKQVSVMFPLASGMPFIFRYKEPTFIHVQGKSKATIDRTGKVSMNMEMHMTYARNLDGSVGFFDTLSNHYSSVGVTNKIQINVPIKMELEKEGKEIKITVEPLQPEQDIALVHYSVWPYSAKQKRDSHVTVAQDPTTKVIERKNKVANIDTRFGQSATGTQFYIQGYSHSKDYRSVNTLLKNWKILGGLSYALNQEDVALTHFNLKYLAKQSPNKRFSIILVYDEHDKKNDQQNKPLFPVKDMKDTAPKSDVRRKEMADRVMSEVKAAKARIIDLSAVFEGPQKYEYMLTAVISSSEIDTKTQYAIFAGRNHPKHGIDQTNIVGSVKTPAIIAKTFEEALKQEAKTTFETEIKLSKNLENKIRFEGYLERTKDQAEKLRNYPNALTRCSEDEAHFNQPFCYAAIIYALEPNHLKASVHYKDVSPSIRNATYQMFRWARHYYYWYEEENVLRNAPEGVAEVEVDMSHADMSFNMTLLSRAGDMKIYNAPLPKGTFELLGVSVVKTSDRLGNYWTGNQYLHFCTVDNDIIKTFSNRTYKYGMSGAWHVLVQDDWWSHGRPADKLVVLSRKPSQKQQEIYISYETPDGQNMEIEMKPAQNVAEPAQILVKTALMKSSQDKITLYKKENSDKKALQYFYLPDGRLEINVAEGRFRALYNGKQIVLMAYDHKKNTRGLCGQMSGDPKDDYRTPYGIVDKPEHYGASYALDKEHSDPKTNQLKEEAKKSAYMPERVYTSILKSDSNWKRYNKEKKQKKTKNAWTSLYKARSYNNQEIPCRVEHQVQYYETFDEICITTERLPSCRSQCRAQGYSQRTAQVVCRPKSDEEFIQYKDQIRKGQNPVVSGPANPKEFRIPDACVE